MAKCRKCGAEFDVDEVRADYNAEYEYQDYDEDYPNNDWCFDCAVDYTDECIKAGDPENWE